MSRSCFRPPKGGHGPLRELGPGLETVMFFFLHVKTCIEVLVTSSVLAPSSKARSP